MAEDNQEVLDLTIQAFRISEDERVFLPVMVGLDGFILSHTTMPVEVPGQDEVDAWLPPRKPLPYVVEPGSGVVMGNIAPDEEYYRMRRAMQLAMENAKRVIEEVDRSYGKVFGRSYGGLLECYRCSDADVVVVGMGSWMGDAKIAADVLREHGPEALQYGATEGLPPLREAMAEDDLMQTFDQSLYQLYREGHIDLETALAAADSPTDLRLRIKMEDIGERVKG
jgi:pyruvate/2-oxoacid:ferredoxin oxidoreductase alpha subunit